MSLGQLVASGRFTSDGSAKDIVLRSDIDFMRVINFTQQATTANPGRGIQFDWQRGLADNAGFMISKENSASTVTFETIATGGFSLKDTSNQAPEAAQATSGTDIAKATSVVTLTAHGYSVGDRVRMYGTVAMLQIAGMEFTVTAVPDANSFTLGYIDMTGFAADATAGFARRIPNNPLYTPERNWITGISAAASAVVTLSVTHNLAVNDQVRLIVPTVFGMTQANEQSAKVTAVSTANNTVTLDLDSSAYTAFAFPTSASVPFTHAQLIPFGDVANGVEQALDNNAKLLMHLAAGVDSPAGSTSDVIYWQAFKSAVVNQE